ncbi:hypothetical protein [Kineosporia babensis]|uniref:Uncharacterized protein n=1 Tax=Kineosporia babensis TaxID=499548 RepID=A0A9X1ST00_9ACTN|nr:hypothetical protein [Kineosporia babensis]MCD5310781.1 hypothetical protein [Kineosporia babensis]
MRQTSEERWAGYDPDYRPRPLGRRWRRGYRRTARRLGGAVGVYLLLMAVVAFGAWMSLRPWMG